MLDAQLLQAWRRLGRGAFRTHGPAEVIGLGVKGFQQGQIIQPGVVGEGNNGALFILKLAGESAGRAGSGRMWTPGNIKALQKFFAVIAQGHRKTGRLWASCASWPRHFTGAHLTAVAVAAEKRAG